MSDLWSEFIEENEQFFSRALPDRFERTGAEFGSEALPDTAA